ncbi:dTMP kinase [Kitasatospora sp. NPDC094019]|uniref:dTMP kinase n=1 Tax=Kitasatospora sp. NPDC094019 TaxID=3364091 RepID=UPI0038271445
MTVLTLTPRTLGPLQRVLLVALLAPVLVLVVVATVPALLVLPFLRDGDRRVVSLLRAHTAALSALLTGSRPDPAGPPAGPLRRGRA